METFTFCITVNNKPVQVTMAHQTSRTVSHYEIDYQKALDLYNSGRFIAAIQEAKSNLADLNLIRYWQIKNSTLIIATEKDWEEAEVSTS